MSTVVEQLWPVAGAESWDAPGLISGDPGRRVARIHLAVDAVAETVDDAISVGADLLLTHHPLLLRGVTSVAEDRYKGAMLARLIRADCALIAAHTNADVVPTGTSAVLAERLGLVAVAPIVSSPPSGAAPSGAAPSGAAPSSSGPTDTAVGLGRVGTLSEPTTLGRLATSLAGILPATATGVRVSGDFDTPVSRVAVCAGAGDSLLLNAAVVASDVYITSDLRHHPASEARENARIASGPALIDVSHWASEWLWLDTAADQLRDLLPGVEVTVSELRTDPWDFVITQ